MSEKYDYIVIGSGFGGSVSAMRLSEKGYSVLVLEKGKEFKASDFPKTNMHLRKYFWAPFFKCFGFMQMDIFKQVMIARGVGVGGGSLVYGNTLYVPSEEFFTNPVWNKYNNWKSALSPYFDKAKFMLGVTSNKQFYREDEVLREVARDMQREHTFSGVDVGVYFGDTEKETDPYFNGLGPKRKGCTLCGGCMVGCRHNAKNTLDKNYLHFAKQNGTEIKASTHVYKIEFKNDTYYIHTYQSTRWGKRNKQVFTSKGLVLSAGVLGTMDLLLKQKFEYQTLPDLSDQLGANIRTNSESVCAVTSKDERLNHGIAIGSGFYPDDNTHVEIFKYPDGSNLIGKLGTLATSKGNGLMRTLKLMYGIITKPHHFIRLLTERKWAEKTIVLLVMQNLDSRMRMVYKRFPFKRIALDTKGLNKIPSYIEPGQQVMHRIAQKVNGIPQNAINETVLNMATTAHILGGSPMGDSPENGLVNKHFGVFNYPHMYVLDGSIVPCNLGVNPSLTITALAEYAMDQIPAKEGFKVQTLEDKLQHTHFTSPESVY